MNKLKLNLAHEAGEILSREELKKILGGADSGSGSSTPCGSNTCSATVECCYPAYNWCVNGYCQKR